jgi:hypothetical protein
MEACSDVTASYDKWMSRLTISSWLTHVKDILNCGCLVAQCVEQVKHFTFSGRSLMTSRSELARGPGYCDKVQSFTNDQKLRDVIYG